MKFQVEKNFLLWLREFIHGVFLCLTWDGMVFRQRVRRLSIMSGRLFDIVDCFVPSTIMSVGLSRIQSFVLWDFFYINMIKVAVLHIGWNIFHEAWFFWWICNGSSIFHEAWWIWLDSFLVWSSLMHSFNKFSFVQLRLILRHSSTPTTRQFSSSLFFSVVPHRLDNLPGGF